LKTKEEIVATALMDWHNKGKTDDNWFKSRIEGAFDSGKANGRAEVEKEVMESTLTNDLYQEGFRVGKEIAFQQLAGWTPRTLQEISSDEYNKGLEEAWNIARKLRHPSCGGMDNEEQEKVFGYIHPDDVLTNLSAKEAIEKFREYEESCKAKTNAQKFEEVFRFDPKKGLIIGENYNPVMVTPPVANDSSWWEEEFEEKEEDGCD